MSNCVFVWDAEGLPPDGDWTMILCRGSTESAFQSAVSIPKLVEDNADVLKARYLAWIHDALWVEGRFDLSECLV